jgi:hypothetical protein
MDLPPPRCDPNTILLRVRVIISAAMFFAYLASSNGIWGAMPSGARLQFLAAVSLTFSGVGFLLDLANPIPGRPAHILFLLRALRHRPRREATAR